MHWRNNHTAVDLVGRNIPQLLPATNLPSPGCVFLQTSCCLVRSSRELYPRMHKQIINLTCMIFCFYINIIISYLLKDLQKTNVWMHRRTPPSYLHHCHCDWLSHTIWSLYWVLPSCLMIRSWCEVYTMIGWIIPHGPTEIAEHIVWRYSSRYNHSRCPGAWNLSQQHNTYASMVCIWLNCMVMIEWQWYNA